MQQLFSTGSAVNDGVLVSIQSVCQMNSNDLGLVTQLDAWRLAPVAYDGSKFVHCSAVTCCDISSRCNAAYTSRRILSYANLNKTEYQMSGFVVNETGEIREEIFI
jgi:hypothetical protein